MGSAYPSPIVDNRASLRRRTIGDRRIATAGRKQGAGRLAAFSTLSLPISGCQLPLAVYMPAIYSQHYGVPLALLGTILLFEKLWGALADPLVGSLSDRTRSRFGRRRPWIVAGGVVYVLAALLLFFPPDPFPPLLLGAGLFTFYLGLSMIQIPYYAWSGELSGDYHERTRIVTYQTVATALGPLSILLLPALVDHVRPDDVPLKLGIMGAILIVFLLPSLMLTLRAVAEPPLPAQLPPRQPLARVLRVILGDTLLMRVLLSDFGVGIAQNIRAALFLFIVTDYVGAPQWASGLFLLQFVFGIAAGPIWNAVARSIGKHRSAIVGELAQVAINLALLLVVPGQLWLLVALTVAQGLAQGSGNQMLRAMVADVADKHRLETGHDRTALFFSVFSVSLKASTAGAVGIALPLVAWLGFDPVSHHNSPAALHGLLLVFALGPAIAHAFAALLLRGFPLDEAAYADIHSALRARATDDITQI
jgi:glycoside/pentoside/hexuronide:cation symporter, GPH family